MVVDFFIFSAIDGSPLAGLAPTFNRLSRSNSDGSVTDFTSAAPAMVDKTGGLYEFVLDDSIFMPDSVVTYVVDCTAAAAARYLDNRVNTSAPEKASFVAYSLVTGAPLPGLVMSFVVLKRRNPDGSLTDLLGTAPPVTDKGAGVYEFVLSQPDGSILSYVVDATAASASRYYSDDIAFTPAATTSMMTDGEAVFAILMADAPTTTLIGKRAYPNQLIEGTDLPALVYQVISNVPQHSLDGSYATRLRQVRVQLDAYARPTFALGGGYLQVQAIANAVIAALEAQASSSLSAWLESSRDLFDNESQFHRVTMDFSIWR